jgi:hypothetical protein
MLTRKENRFTGLSHFWLMLKHWIIKNDDVTPPRERQPRDPTNLDTVVVPALKKDSTESFLARTDGGR